MSKAPDSRYHEQIENWLRGPLDEVLSADRSQPQWDEALLAMVSRIEQKGYSDRASVAADILRERLAYSILTAQPLDSSELRAKAADKVKEIDIALGHVTHQLRRKERGVVSTESDVKGTIRGELEAGQALMPIDKRTDILLLLLHMAREIRGKTRLFKLLFLLAKEARVAQSVPDYYAFVGASFGPFEKTVYDDIEALRSYGLVEVRAPRRRAARGKQELGVEVRLPRVDAVYRLTDQGVKFAQALERYSEEHNLALLQEIRTVHQRYGRLPLRTLLEYVYRAYPEYAKDSRIRDEILGSDQ